METTRIATPSKEPNYFREREQQAIEARRLKGAPKLKGERLRKTLASCPPKTYRKAAA
jgi:hypothetical protein